MTYKFFHVEAGGYNYPEIPRIISSSAIHPTLIKHRHIKRKYSIKKINLLVIYILGWFKNPLSSQTAKLMAATKLSDYLDLKHYKKAKKIKHFIHLGLAQGPQSFATYRSISPTGNLGNQLKNHVLVM